MDPTLYGEHPEQTGVLPVVNRLLLIAILIVVCVGGAIAFMPLLRQISNVNASIETLQATLTKEKALLAKNTKEVQLLQNNPEYLEVKARDRLNLMKQGEVIIRLEAEPAAPAASPLASPAVP